MNTLFFGNSEGGVNRGSAAIYIILMMFLMMTSSAIILSGVLSKHSRASQDYLSSERAFSAANTGMERTLYDVARSAPNDKKTNTDGLIYGTENATYSSKGLLTSSGSPCVVSVGTYRDVVRRVAIGEGSNGCDTSGL